jgi:plasmid stabilization system protein ParE
MHHQVAYRKRAAEEYLSSLFCYKSKSLYAAEQFVKCIDETLKKITEDPKRFRNTYKDFREAKVKKFPYSIVYFIDAEEQRVVITSIFHQKRNPRKKFRDNDL